MFWGLEHVSQEDCEEGNTTEDENVSNMSSDNERLTKEMFSIPPSARSRGSCLSLCLHNLNKYGKMRSRQGETVRSLGSFLSGALNF
jgi:hypothetical protein